MRKKKSSSVALLPSISDAEWTVMRVLWERGTATANEVVQALRGLSTSQGSSRAQRLRPHFAETCPAALGARAVSGPRAALPLEKELKRRLTMIQSPLRHQRLAACIAAMTLTVLSVFLFTTVRGQEASAKPEPAPSAENAGAPLSEVQPLQSLEEQIGTREKALEDSSAFGAPADELKQLRAEVAEIKAALSEVVGHSTGEAKWQNELIQSQAALQTLIASGLGKKHPEILGLREHIKGLEKLVTDGKTASTDVLTPAELSLGVIPGAIKFDNEEMSVRAGQHVRLTFKNEKCPLIYNFVLVKPRTRDAVGALADQMATDPGAAAKLYIPDSPYIIAKSARLIRAGESDVIEFSAPSIPGEYPYICTFPGHWRLMRGILKVEGRGDINAVMKSDDGGPVSPAYIGIVAGTVRVKVEGDTGITSGARVSALGGPGSPAVEAGLMESDVIVGFDGKPVRDAEDLPGMMASRSPGTEVKLEFVRDGEKKSAVVKLGDRAKLLKSLGKSELSVGLPLGLAVPGRDGFVRSPYAPELGLVDVSRAKKGAKVKCPYSGNFFRVPDFKRNGSANFGKP